MTVSPDYIVALEAYFALDIVVAVVIGTADLDVVACPMVVDLN